MVRITGYMVQMGRRRGSTAPGSMLAEVERNPFWCPDAVAAADWAVYLDELRLAHNSVGAVIEVVAIGRACRAWAHRCMASWMRDLAAAMMSINAVKGVEIGAGMAAAGLTGVENADEMEMGPDGLDFGSNHAGGILGGISTGQPVVCRFAVKPTSSILTPRASVNLRARRSRW